MERAGLTPAGKDFLIAALDPFHDVQLKELQGWPDVETAPSVVRCIKQSVTVASNQPAGSNWDCHVVQWPFLDSLNSRIWRRTLLAPGGGNRVIHTPAGLFNMGGLQIYGMAANAQLDVSNAANQVGVIQLDPQITQGSGRIVGMAFEVVNTTSELQKQGQCTVYRQPQSHPTGDAWISLTNPPAVDPGFSAHAIRSPPVTQAQAMLYPGSRQWAAKEGAYVVQTFVGQDNPPQVVRYNQPVVIADPTLEDLVSTSGAPNDSQVLAPASINVSAGVNALNSATKIYPLHTGGAIFTGLSPTSTLTVTLNVFYETFPSTAEQNILVLATPSAQYDPIALEIFSHCLAQMPVGVTAADNAGGGWFDGLMSMIREIAPIAAPILGAINPALGLGAMAVGRGANAYLTQPSVQNRPLMTNTNKRAPAPRLMPAPRGPAPPPRTTSRQNNARTAKKKKKERKLVYL